MSYKCNLTSSKSHLELALVVLSACLNIEAVRAQAVDITSTPRSTQPPSVTEPQTPSRSPIPKKIAPSPSDTHPVTATDIFKIKRFIFVGNTKFSSQQLAKVVAPFTNQPLTFNDLRLVYGKVTNFYVDHGYFKAYAYIPAQTFQGDALMIRVVESGHPD